MLTEDCGILNSGLFASPAKKDSIKSADDIQALYYSCGIFGWNAKMATVRDVPNEWKLPCSLANGSASVIKDGVCGGKVSCEAWQEEVSGSPNERGVTMKDCGPKQGCGDLITNVYDSASDSCVPRKNKCEVYEHLPKGSESVDAACVAKPGCDAEGVHYDANRNMCESHGVPQCKMYEEIRAGTMYSDAICIPKEGCEDMTTSYYDESTGTCRKSACKKWENVVSSEKGALCVLKDGCDGVEAMTHYWDETSSSCRRVTSCTENEYEYEKPSQYSNRICKNTTACSADQYQLRDATEFLDRKCADVTACGISEYEYSAPTQTSDRVCKPITVCSSTEYESSPPTETSDRTCKPLTRCGSDEFLAERGNSTRDNVCKSLSGQCSSQEYESTVASGTQDRVCSQLTVCSGEEYESKAPTRTSDRRCTKLNPRCSPDEYESSTLDGFTQRVCTKRTTCSDMETAINTSVVNRDTECIPKVSCNGFVDGVNCTQGHYGAGNFVYLRTPNGNQNVCGPEGTIREINKYATGNPEATATYPFRCFNTGWAGSYMRMTHTPDTLPHHNHFVSNGTTSTADMQTCNAYADKIRSETGVDIRCKMDKFKDWRYYYLGTVP